ncbi:small metal-binding protein SmbP [Methylocaldum sp.]|uniref:small metal-binding protein SmbP n=1 Tax=Methylocaldum sp. TaxID=1969727 RepID=UPI002D54CC6F|nr:small metal-binding protein SmbP [Methylocaldum sp.]HYE35544.1 small metal-binding protein SmbP [Methylocaldum sp.]
MRSKMLIGLLIPWLGLNGALAAEASQYAQAGISGKDEKGRVFTKEDHVKEAWKHAEAAVMAGEKGNAKGVGEHAKLARTYVEAALTQSTFDEHLTAAMKSLDRAIEQSDAGHADMARQAAQEAIDHLRARKK